MHGMQTLTLHLRRIPGSQVLQEGMTFRIWLAIALFFTLLSGGLAAAALAGNFFCGPGQNLLLYPYYDAKGTVVDWNYQCGEVHRGCKAAVRFGRSAYECSPFMAP